MVTFAVGKTQCGGKIIKYNEIIIIIKIIKDNNIKLSFSILIN